MCSEIDEWHVLELMKYITSGECLNCRKADAFQLQLAFSEVHVLLPGQRRGIVGEKEGKKLLSEGVYNAFLWTWSVSLASLM